MARFEAIPTGGATRLAGLFAGQVPELRAQGIDARRSAYSILKAKEERVYALLDDIRREREIQKAKESPVPPDLPLLNFNLTLL